MLLRAGNRSHVVARDRGGTNGAPWHGGVGHVQNKPEKVYGPFACDMLHVAHPKSAIPLAASFQLGVGDNRDISKRANMRWRY